MSAVGMVGMVGFLADQMAIALTAAYGGIRSPALALAELGVAAPASVTDATALVDAYEAARAAASALGPLHDAQAQAIADDDTASIATTTAALVAGLADAVASFADLAPALVAAANDATDLTPAQRAGVVALAEELQARLIERALVTYLDDRQPRVAAVLYAAGVLEVEEVAAGTGDSLAIAHTRVHVHRDRLLRLVTDPLGLLRDVHRWGASDFDGVTLLHAVAYLFDRVLHRPAELLLPPGEPAGLELFVLALHVDDTAVPPGLLASVRVAQDLTVSRSEPANDGWTIGVDARVAFPIDVDVAIRPMLDLAVETPAVEAEVSLGLTATRAETEPPFLLVGSDGGSRIELHGGEASITGAASWTGGAGAIALEPRVAAALHGARIIVTPGDGFLAEVTGGQGFDATIDVAASWTPTEGLRFGGGATLVIDLPVRAGGARARVEGARLAVRVGTDAIGADLGLTVGATIGPVDVTVSGVGLSGEVTFPDGGGNTGPLNLTGDLRAPDGIGLGIHAGPVSGGGFLARDTATGRYTGALALDVLGVAVSAYGVLDTDVPGVGYSLAAVVSAEFTPIQLGLGFTLDGVGGLIGINRRVDVDALRAALRGPGIGDIFFADDPIAHAARLTGDLGRYFPAAQGRYVFGPAARIGWGTPTLIEGTIALLLEVPSPVRLILLGSVSATLPTADAPIVELHVDVVGELDFGRKTLAIDASLRDSKVAGFPITGDLALRTGWGDPPSFCLSVGGFHSQFRPPPGFPSLRRVQIPIGAGDNPRLDIQGFLALTSNTAQVGASVDLYAAAGPLNIVGNLGFEALIQFVPFGFQVDLWAGVALRRGTHVLAGVHLDGTLRGPTPWHFSGEACLSLWFIDLCVSFDATFGEARDAELPAHEIWPALEEALEDPRSWSAAIPPAVARAVTTATATQTRIDPVSALSVRQKIVPLERQIERFAQVAPTGITRFDLSSASLGGTTIASPVLDEDWFAPAQFEDLTDDERLSRPGYEKMVAGVTLVSDEVTTGAALIKPVAYETIRFPDPEPLPTLYEPTIGMQLGGIATGANATAPLRDGPRGRFAPPRGTPPLVTLEEESFVIASTLDLAPRLDIHPAAGRGAAELALQKYLADHPSARGALQLVPSFEIAS